LVFFDDGNRRDVIDGTNTSCYSKPFGGMDSEDVDYVEPDVWLAVEVAGCLAGVVDDVACEVLGEPARLS
jgi:hypothetical protein